MSWSHAIVNKRNEMLVWSKNKLIVCLTFEQNVISINTKLTLFEDSRRQFMFNSNENNFFLQISGCMEDKEDNCKTTA